MRTLPLVLAGFLAVAALAWRAPAPSAASDRPQVVAGQFLVAAPDIGDPRFHHAVILLVRHDASGAFGLVVNRPIEQKPIADILKALGEKPGNAQGKITIYAGGPVQTEIGFVLHSAGYRRPDTMEIDGKVAITSDPAVLRDIVEGRGPRKYIFAFGYAGWGPGQLEHELARRAWFIVPGDVKLLFGDDPAKLWRDALARRVLTL